MTIELGGMLARNAQANGQDVHAIKRSLNWLGYYKPLKQTGLTEYPDTALFKGIQQFQKDNGLKQSGEIRPGDETLKCLNQSVAKKRGGV